MTREEALNKIDTALDNVLSLRERMCRDVINELFDDFEKITCESCKYYEEIVRKGTLFKRCLFLGTVGDIGFCGRWEAKK